MENYSSKVNYFCVGLGIGAIAAILFAPKSGAETRDEMVRKFEEGKMFAQGKVRELKERAEDFVEKRMEAPARLNQRVSAAFQAGREAYQREMYKAG
jgi:gas vesicle protein